MSACLKVGLKGGLLLAAGLLLACDEDRSTGPECRDCGPRCATFDSRDAVHYHLRSPQGGETFHVGDTVDISFCSEDPERFSLRDAESLVSVDGGATWNVFYHDNSLDTRPEIRRWIVPESLEYVDARGELGQVPLVSDRVLLRISVYASQGDPSVDFAQTDSVFQILPRR